MELLPSALADGLKKKSHVALATLENGNKYLYQVDNIIEKN